MYKETFDFYDRTSLKSYNLDKSMRYQLNILNTLDLFTLKHSENVAAITCRLCKLLHCNAGFTEYCTICAYLHDIGKIFIPPKILQKPGALTDEEYEVIKQHTTLGYKMCMDDLKLRPYAAGALYHHEALNGTGYPNGIKKNQIPYEAQIIAVADEFDAIVSKRQYKSHIGISDTLKILIENAKSGKINSLVLKKLFKVVIEDTEYEIFLTQEYVHELQTDIERLKQIAKYGKEMNKTTSERKKNYYLEGMKLLFKAGETVENYEEILAQYEKALKLRKNIIDNLFTEIKTIKRLKV